MASNSFPNNSNPLSYFNLDPALESQIKMQEFEERLRTFIQWPYTGRLAPIHMAAAGFYQHRPGSDAVSCFCCEVRMEGWHQQTDPIAEHQRASPGCTWNNGTYMTTLDERLASFHTWPIDIKPLPVSMAAAGFYHYNKASDGVACFSCQLKLRDWKQSDDPIQLHMQHSSLHQTCPWILKVTNQPDTYAFPTPPVPPPIAETQRKPRKCVACHMTFSSGNQFHKHRRQAHRLIPGRLGTSLKRPVAMKRAGVTLLGRHRVRKAPPSRRRSRKFNIKGSASDEES